MTPEGKNAWKDPKYFGDKQDDGAEGLLQASNGNLFVAGFSSSDAWVFELERNKPEGFSSQGSVKFGNSKLVDENGNGILEAGERGWVELEVTNTGSNATWQATAQVTIDSPMAGFTFFEKVKIGNLLPGASRRVTIPVSGMDELNAGTVQLNVKILPTTLIANEPLLITIPCLKAALPDLAIINASFTQNGKAANQARLGEIVKLEVEITNRGTKDAEDVQLIFSYPANILPMGERLVKIGNLTQGATTRRQFSFKAEEIYQQKDIGIICQVREKHNPQSARDTFSLPVVERKTEQPSKPESQTELMRLSWLYPEPDASGKPGATVASEDSVYQLKVLALASSQLNARDFTVLLNGKPYNEGSKMGEKGLQKNTDGTGISEYRFQTKVSFPAPGNYKIEIEAGNDLTGKVKSAPIQVIYQPVKPNLHLISIGVPHDDLQYPTQDAADFAKAMRQQEGKLYGKVIEKLYNTKETTTQRALELVVDQLQLDYSKRDLIKDKDVVIIFVSSHGINLPREGFCLLPSDYDMLFAAKTSVNYKTSFLDPLADIKCKKFVLIDACNSGAIEEEEGSKGQSYDAMPDALIELMKARGLRSLVSCQKDERSYEDPTWQNGAFTEAILEALSGKEGKVENGQLKANKNGDKVLTFGELYEYLGKRVPYMVKTTKNGKGQNPIMPETSKELEDVPFFYFGG
ncbi:MAG: caspase family protein [Saprospiraceae bacterium]|nr:caspase family protein [Saprospiraceae bacterium]